MENIVTYSWVKFFGLNFIFILIFIKFFEKCNSNSQDFWRGIRLRIKSKNKKNTCIYCKSNRCLVILGCYKASINGVATEVGTHYSLVTKQDR